MPQCHLDLLTASPIPGMSIGHVMATEELIEAKVGRQNRVVLPAKVRAKLGVEEGSYVGFEIQGDRINLVAIEMRKRTK